MYDYVRTPAQIAWDYNKGAPVGWWKFDECSGTSANDSSGNNYTGTITASSGPNATVGTCSSGAGDEMWDNGTTGKRNASLDFDGADDYVEFGISDFQSNDSQGSLTAWIKPDNLSTWRYIFISSDTDVASHVGFAVEGTTGKIYISQRSGGGSAENIESDYGVSAGVWTHVAYTSDGTDYHFYINGKKTGYEAGNGSGDWFADTTNMDNVRIGRMVRYSGGWGQWNGQIDEVKVFNYTLTDEQISQEYKGGAVNFGY
jgi:hypothetical protein